MIIIFDTETTGLPKNYSASAEDVDNWPRIIQLAYGLYENDGTLIKLVNNLIKPDGWSLPTKETFLAEGKTEEEAIKAANFWIENGYTNEKLETEGKPIKELLNEFVNDRLISEFAVAHNISFDSKIIRAEMFRANMHVEFTSKKFCTMQSSTSFCNLPKKNGKGKKWPTLTELHTVLFQKDFEGSHDAANDVDACAKCFFELVRIGVIKLN